ncbi:MAG: hypothetical protein M3Z02_12225 [Actinomycetota bacterium]|nr:hypothetical protein [Actinomycetota bacterium]
MAAPSLALTAADVGSRVVVRRVLGERDGRAVFGDVLGDLLSWGGGVLLVRTRAGEVAIDDRTVVAAKRVPPARR